MWAWRAPLACIMISWIILSDLKRSLVYTILCWWMGWERWGLCWRARERPTWNNSKNNRNNKHRETKLKIRAGKKWTKNRKKKYTKGKRITEVDDDDAFGEIRDFKQKDRSCRHINFTTRTPTKEYCSSRDVCMSRFFFPCAACVWLLTSKIDRRWWWRRRWRWWASNVKKIRKKKNKRK